MRHAAPVRQELGTRTVFNILGPLSNPAGARDGVFGVYTAELAVTYAETLASLGARAGFVVHGDGGIDELTPTGPNLIVEVRNGDVTEPSSTLDARFYPTDPSASAVAQPRTTPSRSVPCSRASPASSATPCY